MTSTAVSSQLSNLQINTATVGAKAITAAAPGNPTIFTSAAHGLQNGDVGAFAAIVGTMGALINAISAAIVRRVTANTFSVDVDTTGLAYTSGGTLTPVAWTPISNIKSFSGMDGSATVIEVSNLQSVAKEKRMGLQDEGQFAITLDLDPADAGQTAMLAARTAQSIKQFKLTLPTANTATFSGFCKKITADGGVDKVLGRTVDIEITGPVTWA